MARFRPSYPPEFKEEAVRFVRASDEKGSPPKKETGTAASEG
jgi:hypothetical protein